MQRRDFLRMAGAGLTATLMPEALRGANAATGQRPNILWVFSDDHAIQCIGAYNQRLSAFCRQQGITPNIDKLADAGALFQNSFCCNSLCSPSRAAILTGLHSQANGVRYLTQPVTPGVWTYPGTIRDAGYETAVFGKWHLGNTPTNTDYWRILPGQGTYWQPDFIGPNGNEKHTGYCTDIITDMSLDWLRQRDKNKPFMLMVQHKAPHRSWYPPSRYYRLLADVKVPEPDTLFDNYDGRGTAAHKQAMEIGRDMTFPVDLKVTEPDKWPGELNRMTPEQRQEWAAVFGPRNEAFRQANLQGDALTRWKYQEYMKDYLRCIKAVDDSVGRLTDYLAQEGLDKNTVVIYAADQGFYNGEHGWFDKRWIYEESLHMPFIIRWPGVVQPGSRPDAMIQNIDYAPTFVEIAGGKTPAGLHGRSMVPVLRGRTPADWRKSLYYHYYDPGHSVAPHYGVHTTRYTLAYFPTFDEWELYDLEKDPEEMKSVYADPAYAATVAELKAELERLRKEYGITDEAGPRAENQPAGAPAGGGGGARRQGAKKQTE